MTSYCRQGLGVVVLALLFTSGCGSSGDVSRLPSQPAVTDPLRTARAILVNPSTVSLPAPPPASGSSQAMTEESEAAAAREQSRTDPTLAAAVMYWQTGNASASSCRRWNETTRGLVAKYKTAPPRAERIYALVAVAQYDALIAARAARLRIGAPQEYPDDKMVIGGAAAAVLKGLYPDDAAQMNALIEQQQEARLAGDVACRRSALEAGRSVGDVVGKQTLLSRADDGSAAFWEGDPPLLVGPNYWYPDTGNGLPAPPAVLPLWGRVRPFLVENVEAMRPPPPPYPGSPEFAVALAEVRQISDTRTSEQLTLARFWADGAGTATPPGHWNQIACDLALQNKLSEAESARMLAYLNIALFDAGICCWDTKYAYGLLRPSQADPAITLPVGLPNFPAYTSGHSSFSGAASVVLGYFFPDKAGELKRMAEEASLSRMYGGIHYRFDGEVGLSVGRSIGNLAVGRVRLLDNYEN